MRTPVIVLCTLLTSPALGDAPNVVTDTPVVHSLVSQVMGDLGAPVVLLDRGGDPHSFQLRPSQAQAVSDADLVFWVGADLTPWLDRTIQGVGTRGEVITLLEVGGLRLQGYLDADDHAGHAHEEHGHENDAHDHAHEDHGHARDAHDHAHAEHGHENDAHDHAHEEHGHENDAHDHAHEDHGHENDAHDHAQEDHGHGHDAHDHAHDGNDPHAWLDPGNARAWIDAIADALSHKDPANADTYAANATAAKHDIDALEAEIRAALAPVGSAAIITFHDAYGYLATHFGLNVAGTITLGDAASPGAGRLAGLQAMLAERQVVCIFPEVNHSPAYANVVIEGTEVRMGAELDPAGVALETGPALYRQMMTDLATKIADCVTRAG